MKINKTNKTSSAFTLLIARRYRDYRHSAALAVPALTSALAKAQMTGTMNNARQLYLAQFQMANDGAATGDTSLAYVGDLPAADQRHFWHITATRSSDLVSERRRYCQAFQCAWRGAQWSR